MDRFFFVAGCVLAFLGVAAGAFGAHALAERIPPDRLGTFEIGVRYQMYHALALLGIAWATTRWPGGTIHAAGILFIAGAAIFSGTLYGIAFGGPRWLGAVTPIGGVCFLVGWVLAAARVLRG